MDKGKGQRKRKVLRREYVAMYGHYQLLRGLLVLCEVRIQDYRDVVDSLGLQSVQTVEEISIVRDRVCSTHMNSQVKARHLYDGYHEIDTYTWGPVELFFCIGHALVSKYKNLKRTFPDVSSSGLDSYLEKNQSAFSAIKHLRDMTLHPGYDRNPGDAFGLFYGEVADGSPTPISEHPYEIVPQLVNLFGQFLEELREKSS